MLPYLQVFTQFKTIPKLNSFENVFPFVPDVTLNNFKLILDGLEIYYPNEKKEKEEKQ